MNRVAAGLLVLAVLLVLMGCATPAEQLAERVPVACIDRLPAPPVIYADGELSAMPDGALVLALHADRLALRAYAFELEAVARPCVMPSSR